MAACRQTRMKLLISLTGILFVAAALGVAQEAAQSSPAATEVRRLERSKFDALARKDNAALDALFDNALLLVDADGALWTKAEYLANRQNPNSRLLQIVPETMASQVFGEVVIVVGIYAERGMDSGHPYQRRARFVDTWTRKKGKWVCIAATATSAIS
jgi:ketosteroid isomerase-like protein